MIRPYRNWVIRECERCHREMMDCERRKRNKFGLLVCKDCYDYA